MSGGQKLTDLFITTLDTYSVLVPTLHHLLSSGAENAEIRGRVRSNKVQKGTVRRRTLGLG